MESPIGVDKNETVNEGVEIVCVDDSSDDDADVLGTPVWLREMKLTGKFITVKECLSKKKYCGIANNMDLQKLLKGFLRQPAGDYFSGERMDQFTEIEGKFRSTHSTSQSALNCSWSRGRVSEYLAVLFMLSEAEEDALNTQSRRRPGRNAKKTDLDKMMGKLRKKVQPAMDKFYELKVQDNNKKLRTKSLDYQTNGQRLQDLVQVPTAFDVLPCPVCDHFKTSSVQDNAAINAYNAKQRANAKKGKTEGLTCMSGCHCFRDAESDCMCQVVWEEQYRTSIAQKLKHNKHLEEKESSKGGVVKQQGAAKQVLGKYFSSLLQNNAVTESQNYRPDRSDEEMQEDVATRTAVQLYSNQHIARDPEIRRQLASAIPKRSVLSWRNPDGTMEEISFEEGRKRSKALTKDTGVKSIKKSVASSEIAPRRRSSSDHVPSHANFTSNRSNVRSQDVHRARRNNLADEPVNPPVAAASVGTTSAISPVPEQNGMLLRVRKRATNNLRDRAISPTSKKLNRKIFKGLVSPMDKEIVAAIEDVDDGKMGSQEVLREIEPIIGDSP